MQVLWFVHSSWTFFVLEEATSSSQFIADLTKSPSLRHPLTCHTAYAYLIRALSIDFHIGLNWENDYTVM